MGKAPHHTGEEGRRDGRSQGLPSRVRLKTKIPGQAPVLFLLHPVGLSPHFPRKVLEPLAQERGSDTD